MSSVLSTYGGGGLTQLGLSFIASATCTIVTSTMELFRFKSKSSNQSGLPQFYPLRVLFQLTTHEHLI